MYKGYSMTGGAYKSMAHEVIAQVSTHKEFVAMNKCLQMYHMLYISISVTAAQGIHSTEIHNGVNPEYRI